MSDSVQPRVFLVVVDESEEYRIAVHYAARRAAHTGGRVALLYVIEPADRRDHRTGAGGAVPHRHRQPETSGKAAGGPG